jgi:hypothetical protein
MLGFIRTRISRRAAVSAPAEPRSRNVPAMPQARRGHRWSWMPSGWTGSVTLDAKAGGTTVLTIGVPDDFFAVRVGFANVTSTPFRITKAIACASASYGDYVNPTDATGNLRDDDAWVPLTFVNRGADDSRIVTITDAPTEIVVAGNAADFATGETTNPVWTFTDWVPLASLGPDPASGMRVLMLRALIPSGQTVTFANNSLREWRGDLSINHGYDVLVGGIKFGYDRVSSPTQSRHEATKLYIDNQLSSGSHFPLVQVLTRNAGIVGMTTGDSHHSGTSTSAVGLNSYLIQSLLPLGRRLAGQVPIGLVTTANGGLTSQQFFSRLDTLLPVVRPSFVVLPGWTFNERNGPAHADASANNVFASRLLASADLARSHGAIPIFLTPMPRDAASMTDAQVIPWRALRETILGMRAAGDYVLDVTPLLGSTTDGMLDGTYDPRLNVSTDNVHPNDAGHAAIATPLTELVREVCSLT